MLKRDLGTTGAILDCSKGLLASGMLGRAEMPTGESILRRLLNLLFRIHHVGRIPALLSFLKAIFRAVGCKG